MKKVLMLIACIFVINSSVLASDKPTTDKPKDVGSSGASESAAGDSVTQLSLSDLLALLNTIQGDKPHLKALEASAGDSNWLLFPLAQAPNDATAKQTVEDKPADGSAAADSNSAAAEAPSGSKVVSPLKPVKVILSEHVLFPNGILTRKVQTRKVGTHGAVTSTTAAFPVEYPAIEGFRTLVCTNAECIAQKGPHKYYYNSTHPNYHSKQAQKK